MGCFRSSCLPASSSPSVLLGCLGYFLGEANRTGEDLLEGNRFELASSVAFAVSIAFGARTAVRRAGKHLGM